MEAQGRDQVTVPSAEEILSKLYEGHPRLLVTKKDFARVKELVNANQQAERWCETLRRKASAILSEPPSGYEIPDNVRLLATSRRVVDRVYTLALFWWLDGDRRCVDRAWRELDAAAKFPDWNPSHFLDTAEMTHAFAIGYDWLYDQWTEQQRRALRGAIVKHGLEPGLDCYRGRAPCVWWVESSHNWNQVCNGGLGLGAMAIGDEEPGIAGPILHNALGSIQRAMVRFAPDGGWDEGPGYWNYATSYNTIFLAALDSALGTDFGLSHIPGYCDAGFFPLYLTGPTERTFNYADGGDRTIRAPQMFWFARTFDRTPFAWYQRRAARPEVLDLLWFDPRGQDPEAEKLPTDRYFRGIEVAALRSSWNDPDALFVGFKAGDNKANHSNLDLGTFVLDALGRRWAIDPGADDYNMPGYWDRARQRWTYYRMRAEGHNTVLINPDRKPDQDPNAAAKIVPFESKPDRAFAIADLTAAYAGRAKAVRRGVALHDGRSRVLVQDEIATTNPSEVWWFLHTQAQARVEDDGTSAMLSHDDARLWLRILSPLNAAFTVMSARPLPSSPDPQVQNRNDGVRKLAIRLSGVTNVRLAVVAVPLREGEAPPAELPRVTALENWE